MEGRGKLKERDYLQDLGVNGRSGKAEGKNHLEDLGANGRKMFKWILNN